MWARSCSRTPMALDLDGKGVGPNRHILTSKKAIHRLSDRGCLGAAQAGSRWPTNPAMLP